MTRYTDTIRRTAGIIRLEATGERDECDPYRHKWVTRLRFGLLSAEGPNTRGAVDRLADELRELAFCPEAITALAKVQAQQVAERELPVPAKAPAPFAESEAVEVLIQDTWCPAEYLNTSHGGSLIAVWSERCGSLVVPKERVRAVNRPSLSDVG